MEAVFTAAITGVLTLAGVLASNSRSRAVMECKIDALAEKVQKHNEVIERVYVLERRADVVENDVASLKREAGR